MRSEDEKVGSDDEIEGLLSTTRSITKEELAGTCHALLASYSSVRPNPHLPRVRPLPFLQPPSPSSILPSMARYEPLKQSSEDLDLDLLPMRTRRDPGGTGRAATTVRIARNYGGWLVAVLLLLHSVRHPFPRRIRQPQLTPFPQIRTSSSSSRREKGCWDPYTSLGYIYRPSNGSIRWIPYPPTLSSPRNTLSFPTAIDDSLDPPPEALALAPPAYGEMLNRIGTDEGMKDMEWARGRRIVFVGDSCVLISLLDESSPSATRAFFVRLLENVETD